MSEDAEVVIEESNPTNEDHSIDNAIEELFDSTEAESTEETTEATEPEAESQDETESVVDELEESETPNDEEGEFSLPNNMPKELQEALSDFDDDSKKQHIEVFKKMQGSFTKKNQDFAEEKKLAETVNKAFEDNGLNVGGIEKKQALVSNYIAFDRLLESNPKAAVKQIMDYAGIKPDDFGANPTPTESSEDEFLTDTELNLKKQLDAQAEEIRNLKQSTTASRQEAQSKIVNDFRNETNEAGELLRPHFDAVKTDMMDLADLNPSLTIEQLYTKAVRMNDDLYQQSIDSAKKAAISGLEAKRKQEVEKAKRLNKQSRPTSSVDSTIVDQDALFEKIALEAGWS